MVATGSIQANWLLIFNIILLQIQAGTLMVKHCFYEQPPVLLGSHLRWSPQMLPVPMQMPHTKIHIHSFPTAWHIFLSNQSLLIHCIYWMKQVRKQVKSSNLWVQKKLNQWLITEWSVALHKRKFTFSALIMQCTIRQSDLAFQPKLISQTLMKNNWFWKKFGAYSEKDIKW